MKSRQILGWSLVCLIGTSSLLPALAYPSVAIQGPEHNPQYQQSPQYEQFTPEDARKFAEKPNSVKKIIALEDRNDLDDLSTNNISDGGFSWSNMIAMFMQMIFNPAGGHNGPNKSESLDADTGVAPSPWTNLLTVGLKILSAFLGGGGVGGDGIDKVDNSSPMQFINIVVNLLDALKTSFSHRSMAARSLGKKDSVSEAAVASLAVFKGYVKTMKTSDDTCMQRYMCEANRECATDTNSSSSIYCQLGTYLASFMIQRSGVASPMETYYEAGRRGRSGDDCHQLYLSCNEV